MENIMIMKLKSSQFQVNTLMWNVNNNWHMLHMCRRQTKNN